jgi:hypothetical protein
VSEDLLSIAIQALSHCRPAEPDHYADRFVNTIVRWSESEFLLIDKTHKDS